MTTNLIISLGVVFSLGNDYFSNKIGSAETPSIYKNRKNSKNWINFFSSSLPEKEVTTRNFRIDRNGQNNWFVLSRSVYSKSPWWLFITSLVPFYLKTLNLNCHLVHERVKRVAESRENVRPLFSNNIKDVLRPYSQLKKLTITSPTR